MVVIREDLLADARQILDRLAEDLRKFARQHHTGRADIVKMADRAGRLSLRLRVKLPAELAEFAEGGDGPAG